MTSPTDPVPEVRASRLVLVDEAGRERAVLEMRKGQPIFQLIGTNGRPQIQIGIIPEWDGVPHLFLESPDGTSFLRLDAAKDGNAGIQLGASHRRVWINSNRVGQLPTVELTNDQGHLVARMPANDVRAVPNHPAQLARPEDLTGRQG